MTLAQISLVIAADLHKLLTFNFISTSTQASKPTQPYGLV